MSEKQNLSLRELQREIKRLEKQLDELDARKSSSNSKNKSSGLFKTKYWTTTKIIIHTIQILSVLAVGVIIYMCKYLIAEPMYLSAVLGTLVTNVFVAFNLGHKYYVQKAMADSENMNKKEKRMMDLDFAEKMTTLLENKKITPEGVTALKVLISESNTNVAYAGNGVLVTDSTTYGASNPPAALENIAAQG